MNSKYYAFHSKSYFGGPVEVDINIYQPIRQRFLNHWHQQAYMANDVFINKPYGSNPFKEVLFVSKGRYDIANHYNGFGSNFLFVSDKMIDIFKSVKVPDYELFPLKYRQKGNIYEGYFLAFIRDYSIYFDFQNSRICYKPFTSDYYQPIKFRSADDMASFINENASIRYPNGGTNLGEFRFPEIRFHEFV